MTNDKDTIFRIILADGGSVHLGKGRVKLNVLVGCTHSCLDPQNPVPGTDTLDLGGIAQLLGLAMRPGTYVTDGGGKFTSTAHLGGVGLGDWEASSDGTLIE
jgi:hypothetical protein